MEGLVMANARILPRSVLVIDSGTDARQIIASYLTRHGFAVSQAVDPAAAMGSLSSSKPDMILVNWSFCGLAADVFIEGLRGALAHPHTPVIGITHDAVERDAIEALEGGADDFLIEPFSPAMLLARMMAVLRRRAPELSDREISVNALTLNPARQQVTCAVGRREIRVDISPTEFRMLHFFMSKPEVAHTRQEIRAKVWGEDQSVDERTVDAHIKRLRAALAPAGMDFMIQTVRSVGYRLSRNPSSSELMGHGPIPDSSAQGVTASVHRPVFVSAH